MRARIVDKVLNIRRLQLGSLPLVCTSGLVWVCSWMLTGCHKQGRQTAQKVDLVVPVALQAVHVQPVQRTVEVVGTLFGDEEATISSKVMGKVVTLHKDMGDRAAPGEPLALVEPTDYELARNQKALA